MPDSNPTTQPSSKQAEPKSNPSPVRSAYRRLAPVYDWIFGPSLEKGRRTALRAVGALPGDSVLEVGVGTGLSLHHWDPECRVTGIDLSPEMLGRAEKMCQRRDLENVELHAMDAQNMEFSDNQFDKIAAMYVVSVVDDPTALMQEILRVAKPGARVVIVNHFEHRHPWVRTAERSISRATGLIGFNAALPVDPVIETEGFRVLEVVPANWLGYWTLIIGEVVKPGSTTEG
ncbi:MAG: methyltransferase domain-containing protein [Verrucomicrobia bacterium]|jgi:phosphatidylethanolamine/phosphatidyl-N-methylethanolamine N-methyltransferase|nr:methyltransferase domain-containing protein [Verrucomicrobiota bacterium]